MERSGMDRSTVSALVRTLVKKGLLRHRRSEKNYRRDAVHLTAEGWKALHACARIVERLDVEILRTPLTNKQAWIDELALVVGSLGKHRDVRLSRNDKPRDANTGTLVRSVKPRRDQKPRH
jgi:DNA-binding MarR family transcriptional regulator